jgi:hypothetical protein
MWKTLHSAAVFPHGNSRLTHTVSIRERGYSGVCPKWLEAKMVSQEHWAGREPMMELGSSELPV